MRNAPRTNIMSQECRNSFKDILKKEKQVRPDIENAISVNLSAIPAALFLLH